jgi:hypothetical protein
MYVPTSPHCFTTQKTDMDISIVMRISKLTLFLTVNNKCSKMGMENTNSSYQFLLSK